MPQEEYSVLHWLPEMPAAVYWQEWQIVEGEILGTLHICQYQVFDKGHFNQAGHSISDMTVTIIEKVHNKDEPFRKERKKFFIKKMNTKYKGMNRKT